MSEQTTILVIDDEKAIRDSCTQVLAKDGYRTEATEDGESGLRKIREIKPDLVLIDLKMPGINGMELLEMIWDTDPNIISVVITGYATIESAVEAMKHNAYDFLPKPFTPDELRIVVRRGLEQKRLVLESARLRYEKEKMRKHFITFVSHQLRSPLISVRQYFEVILGGFAGEVAGRQKGMIEDASERIDELINLINNWLDMSRIDAGNLTGKFESVDLDSLLSQIVELLRPIAEAKNITLQTSFHGSPAAIRGCRESLKQAFTNLITNGIDYNRKGGTVTIKGKEEADCCVVQISDTGIGISRENLPFVFEEFFRVKTKDTQGIAGSGLGLSIVKRIIEAHHGSVKVVSEPGKGAAFSVFLPKKELK